MIRECQIVFSLFGYLHILGSCNKIFDTVIIDDAQSIGELTCLVPLRYGCKRLIVSGDENCSFNPFIDTYDETTLQPFNILGRCKTLTNSVFQLENVYRNDTPVVVTLYNFESNLQIATAEKELQIIKKVVADDVDFKVVVILDNDCV